MEKDLMFYFDKKSPYERHELGEIQTNFNMCMTIDGTKDSLQVQVYGFVSNEIMPNTILWHKATNTWWIVKRDIVKRNANEKDYYYTHNLTLTGAIDLLSSRDLTDCGFNDKTYTIDQFIQRLFGLSTFEFSLTINYGNNVDENKIVDYIKSFENYTLLSALREFLNGYNCDGKLTFTTTTISNKVYISGATLVVIPRTGNVDLEQVDIDTFDDIRETKTMNKESYGTSVISNAQNVNSTMAKVYPQVGGTSLTGDEYNTQSKDLFFRTPTPIYDVIWLRSMSKIHFIYYEGSAVGNLNIFGEYFYPQSRATFNHFYDKFIEQCANSGRTFGPHTQDQLDYMWKVATGVSQITFYNNGFNYNIHTNDITKKPETPYLSRMLDGYNYHRYILLTDKQTRDGIKEGSTRAMYWERGGNTIKGYNIFFDDGSLSHATSTYYSAATDLKLYGIDNNRVPQSSSDSPYSGVFMIGGGSVGSIDIKNTIRRLETMWQINYIPMSDIKIKYDNSRNDIDTQVYNQNGKLNDSVALSKLVDSYSKEIQSDNITRYMWYNDFSAIPQVGTIVDNGGEKYVINNISYDFYVNEESEQYENPYYIECEFTMSKYISVKSLMVNPNSNIRDYAIPQKYNVKRRHLYRDYYEFSLSVDSDANQDTPYVALDNYLMLSPLDQNIRDYSHTAIMKLDYDGEVDGSTSWYYQLSSTAYVMNKTLYEIIDFNDNNIIGYDMQNATTGFNMSNLFDTSVRNITTPISYVDDSGKVKGFTLQMVNSTNLNEMYDKILKEYGNYDTQTLSSHVFVGEDFYYGLYTTSSKTNEGCIIMQLANGLVFPYDNNTKTLIKVPTSKITFVDSDIEFDTLVVNSIGTISYGSGLTPNIGSYQFIEENGVYYFEMIDIGGCYTEQEIYSILGDFFADYDYRDYTYKGAIDIKDYQIEDLNYNKDAIEVPVFEYILQLGDTPEIEIGERVLDNTSGLVKINNFVIRNKNTTSQLNANKWFGELTATGSTFSSPVYDYSYQYSATSDSCVLVEFENNNTIMRLSFYSSQFATFYGDSDQTGITYSGWVNNGTQIPKSQLIGKDIVIYKSAIKSMYYDPNEDVATCDYDNELMFIIHNPKDANFDGDDLLVRVNYYRLK